VPNTSIEIVDNVDKAALATAVSAVSLKLRAIVQEEVAENPERYQDLLQQEAYCPGPALEAMEAIADNLEFNKDIRSKYVEIDRLIKNQDSRAEVFSLLLQSHDYRRFTNFLKARNQVETLLLKVAERSNLDPASALVLLQYLTKELETMEKRLNSNTASGKDISTLLSKIDQLVDMENIKMEKNLKGSTPQNREIMRRVGHKLLKAVAEKISKGNST
jgi:hypothetical protein